jgi:hypothetical protein
MIASVVLLALLPVRIPDLQVGGFLQGVVAQDVDSTNPSGSDQAAEELRGQVRLQSTSDNGEFLGKLDVVGDRLGSKTRFDWQVREAYYRFRVGEHFDFKVGRQVLTWGTGDFVFINDLFAKDFDSFFVGRDDPYLKAPQDSLRMESYAGAADLSLVWTPLFTPNRLPDPERLSFYSPFGGAPGGGGAIVGGAGAAPEAPLPARNPRNSEAAGRLSARFGAVEAALYGYQGFYKSPIGFRPGANFPAGPDFGTPVYPRLAAGGASVRTPLSGLLVWSELGYYDSQDDRTGKDPFMPNSTASGLVGVEHIFRSVFQVNAQVQTTWMFHHDLYAQQQAAGGYDALAEAHTVLTNRINWQLFSQTLTLSSFVFYSPDAKDYYWRGSASYAYNDHLILTAGSNLFGGPHISTDFAQFRDDGNAYAKVTYGF